MLAPKLLRNWHLLALEAQITTIKNSHYQNSSQPAHIHTHTHTHIRPSISCPTRRRRRPALMELVTESIRRTRGVFYAPPCIGAIFAQTPRPLNSPANPNDPSLASQSAARTAVNFGFTSARSHTRTRRPGHQSRRLRAEARCFVYDFRYDGVREGFCCHHYWRARRVRASMRLMVDCFEMNFQIIYDTPVFSH